jgi:hypothetical protein
MFNDNNVEIFAQLRPPPQVRLDVTETAGLTVRGDARRPVIRKEDKMAFPTQEYSFDARTLNTVNEVGAVYGLFRPNPTRPNYFICLYVGETNNLRRRLFEHYNNPPVAGITHFFVEVVADFRQRAQREKQLIAELKPIGNQTRGG